MHTKIIISRRLLLGVVTASGLTRLALPARAQGSLPAKSLRIVVGYPPGQTTDIVARTFAVALGKELGRSIYVDNRPGANGILGAQEVAKSVPDGATLLLGPMSSMAVNPSLYRKLPYDPEKDFIPLALVSMGPLILVANPNFPPNNLKEFIAYAKERPDKINYASGGTGITGHLAMEILQSRAGIKLNHVPYKGSPAALNDVIGGQVSLMFDPVSTTLPQIKAGKLKALAVTGSSRIKDMDQAATLDEQGLKGLKILSWLGFFVPAHMPDALVETLSSAIQRATLSTEVRDTLRLAGSEPEFVPRAKFTPFLHEEIAKWGQAVKDAKVQID